MSSFMMEKAVASKSTCTHNSNPFASFLCALIYCVFLSSLFFALPKVSVPIVSNDRCKSMFLRAGRHEFIPDIFLCAGHDLGFVFMLILSRNCCLFRRQLTENFFTNGSKFFFSLCLFTGNLIHVR